MQFFFELARNAHTKLYSGLKETFPNCFEPGELKRPKTVSQLLNSSKLNDRKEQLFIRAVTNGILSERDRLLYYTISEFYNERSLFIEEQEKKKEYYEKLNKK